MILLTSFLRTVVSYLWGIIIVWLITVLPPLQPLEEQLLGLADLALPILAAVISAAWYAFWRWLEPRLPDWLTRALLGSAKAPNYDGRHEAGAVIKVTVNASDDPAEIAQQVIRRLSQHRP